MGTGYSTVERAKELRAQVVTPDGVVPMRTRYFCGYLAELDCRGDRSPFWCLTHGHSRPQDAAREARRCTRWPNKLRMFAIGDEDDSTSR